MSLHAFGKLQENKFEISLALIILFSAFLLFSRLGERVLWNDEAQTAVLARQINKVGIPQFSPGDNLPTDSPTLSDFNEKGIFVWNTWLPYYLVAASFRIFGESEFSARLPFAVIGFLTFLLSLNFYAKLFERDRRSILISMLLLCSSVPFILHLRQCRYYALPILSAVWIVWGFLLLLNGEKKGIWHISAAGILCFYSFYVIAFLNLAALWTYALLYKRERVLAEQLMFSTGIIFLFSLPAIYYLGLYQSNISAVQTGSISRSLWVFLLWINGFIIPFALPVVAAFMVKAKGRGLLLLSYILFLAGAAFKAFWVEIIILLTFASIASFVYIQNRKKFDQRASYISFLDLLTILIIIYVLSLGLMAPYPFFRYITPLVPLIFPAAAILISRIISTSKVAGYAILVLICTSTILNAVPLKLSQNIFAPEPEMHNIYSVSPRDIWRWTSVRSDLVSYFREISAPIEEPERGLVDYFRKNGRPGESIRSSYDEMTLLFYLPELRVVPRFLKPDRVPDYLIQRGEYKLWLDDELLALIKQHKVFYVDEQIPYPNIVWGNNPDPLYHLFTIPTGKPNITISKKLHL